MNISRKQLYAHGEPLGVCVTRRKPDGRYLCGGGGGDSGGGGGTSSTIQSIPDELKPLASAYTSKAINLGNQGFTPYYGDRYADLNGTQQAGINAMTSRAVNGDPTMDIATQTLQKTLAGGETNPYLDGVVKKAQSSVSDTFNNMTKPQTETAMANSGSFGNAGLAETMQNQQKAAVGQASDIATSMYGAAYDGDKARQQAALQLAPTYGNQAYTDADKLLSAGQIQQDQQQQDQDFDYSQFQDYQNLPYKQLSAMSGVFGSNLGGASTTTQSGGSGGGK